MNTARTETELSHILASAEPSSAQIVDEALSNLLISSEMGPGSKLPTERALSEQLDVPRSAVRNSLARLEAGGKVVRKMGSGTYVADVPSPHPGNDDASPHEIMQTRLLVEPTLADLIVVNANASDIEKIRVAMKTAEASTNFAEFEIWDARFHQALADATQNRLMMRVYATITTSRDLAEWGEMKRQSITEARRQAYNREHEKIFTALKARNATAAREAISAHLITVRHNLLGV